MGDIDGNFVTYVKNNYLYLSQYFKSGITFSDPHTGIKVDFNHLIATLNGLYYDTPESFKDPRGLDEVDIDNLCGWAGDLQSVEGKIIENFNKGITTDIYDQAASMIGAPTGSSRFSISDVLSDVDAVNIHNMKYYSMAQAFYDYYSGSAPSKRFSSFNNDIGSKVPAIRYTAPYIIEINKIKIQWPLTEKYDPSSLQMCEYSVANAYNDYIKREIANEN
jgi:hypothetical protein